MSMFSRVGSNMSVVVLNPKVRSGMGTTAMYALEALSETNCIVECVWIDNGSNIELALV